MKGFCIPKHIVEELKLAASSGEFKIDVLYDMNSQQRNEYFQKWVDPATAKGMNAGFEQALISTQVNALERWAEKIFTEDKTLNKKNKKNVLDKINELRELGVLDTTSDTSDSYLSDLVEEALGTSITADEAMKIVELSRELESLAATTDELGLPTLEFWQKMEEMEDYLQSLTPSSQLKIATSTIGRGTMLASIKSPLTNIVGNSVIGLQESVTRRIATGIAGGDNSDLIKSYMKKAVETYTKTGYDITRIMTLDARQTSLGEDITHSEGKGTVRKVGRIYEDIVFRGLMGTPDVAFAAAAMADSINLITTRIAKKEGLSGEARKTRAREIMLDAFKIEPTTDLGKNVREQAVADAQYATFTNDTWYTKISLGIRGVLNQATGDLRVGDLLMPFVKTPANVVGVAIESTGLGLAAGAIELLKARNEILSGNPEIAQKAIRRMIRSGLGMTLAFILYSMFEPDDFYGALPLNEKERQLMYEKNASPNTIRIGDKWVSLDYFGNIGSALTGMMYAKKYGDSWPERLVGYTEGTKSIIAQLPGIEEFSGLAESISGGKNFKALTAEDYITGITDYSIDFVRARTIPGFVNDIAKATDKYERDTRLAQKEGDPFAKLKASIPFVRQSLPIRRTLFQKKEEGEGASVMLFGARIKTADRNRITDEYTTLSQSNNLPTMSEIEDRKAVMQLKGQIGKSKFEEAKEYFGRRWYELILEAIDSEDYKKLESDEEKKDYLNKMREQAINEMLVEYGHVDPETGRATRPKKPSKPRRPSR